MRPLTYQVNLRVRFRGITVRQGMLLRGAAGWGEWSPFLDYSGSELVPWLRAAYEAADEGWPPPVRTAVEVNGTVPAVGPDRAAALALASGCRTMKVKVAEPGQTLADDLDRVAAVRGVLGPTARIRVDANGAWSLTQAEEAIRRLARYDLEYVEQPCSTVMDLAALRRRLARSGLEVAIAADEAIRRADDPYAVVRAGAADVAVLKVQPLGGVRACLAIASGLDLPVVVSSALETSVGIQAGLALAAALPDLPYACGLDTVRLLAADVADRPLLAEGGRIAIRDLALAPDMVERCAAPPEVADFWQARLMATRRLAGIDG